MMPKFPVTVWPRYYGMTVCGRCPYHERYTFETEPTYTVRWVGWCHVFQVANRFRWRGGKRLPLRCPQCLDREAAHEAGGGE